MNVYLIKYDTGIEKHIVAESVGSAISIAKDYFINDFVDIESVNVAIKDVLVKEQTK